MIGASLMASSERRSHQQQIERLPMLLHEIARGLRRGDTLTVALGAAAADPALGGGELQRTMARVERGVPAAEALDEWAADLDHPDADMVRAVLRVGLDRGTALAAALDRAGLALDERADLRRQIRALSAQARASALVLCVAPLLFVVLMAAVDPGVVTVMFGSWPGRSAVVLGVVLDGCGWLWIRRLVERVDR